VPPVVVTEPLTVIAPVPNGPLSFTVPESVPSSKKFLNEPDRFTVDPPTIAVVLRARCTPAPNGFVQFSCAKARPESLGKSTFYAVAVQLSCSFLADGFAAAAAAPIAATRTPKQPISNTPARTIDLIAPPSRRHLGQTSTPNLHADPIGRPRGEPDFMIDFIL
jgi:hypothetical protein